MKALVVEDDAGLRCLIYRKLLRLEIDTTAPNDIQELEKSLDDPYQLVVLDNDLGKWGGGHRGPEYIARMRDHNPNVVIMLASSADNEVLEQIASNYHIDKVIPKRNPRDLDIIAATAREYVH